MLKRLLLIPLILCFLEGYCWVFVPNIHIGPSYKIYDSELGTRVKPNADEWRITRDFRNNWHTNKYGMRGQDTSVHKSPKETEFRIVSIGNSHAFGVGVKDDENYSARIEDSLSNRTTFELEVLNMSVPDVGTGYFSQAMPEILSYQPDLIIWRYDHYNFDTTGSMSHYGEGNITWDEVQRPSVLRSFFAGLDSGALAYSGAYAFLRMRMDKYGRRALWGLCRMSGLNTVGDNRCTEPTPKIGWHEKALVDSIFQQVDDAGVPMLMLIFRLNTETQEKWVEDNLSGRNQLNFQYLLSDKQYRFPHDGHMNGLAHELTASTIIDWIELNDILSHHAND